MVKNRITAGVVRNAACFMMLCLASSLAQGAAFNNVTDLAGVRFIHISDPDVPVGAGAAFVDFDNDGDDDLFAVGGELCNRLFRNNGDGTFIEVPNAAGAAECASISRGIGAADYDNDGDQDLFISNNGQNHLYRNILVETGNVRFVNVTASAGMDNDGAFRSSSAVWGDYDNDGNLDLFVGNHAYTMIPLECNPDYLWHNNGDGTFTDVGPETGVALSGIPGAPGCALAATFSDYDNDGDADLMVINDFGNQNIPNRLFRNDGPGVDAWQFTDVSAAAGFDYAMAGMGIGISDIDHDGHFDYYMSDAGPNDFGYNNGDGTFTELAASLGILASDAPIWGHIGLVSWGNAFFDLDMDGWEDLVVCNGGAPQHKYPGLFGGANYIQKNPCYVYRNRWPDINGFVEMHGPLNVGSKDFYRGLAFSDYDDDGDVDMFFGNFHGVGVLYRNNMGQQNPNNHWLKIKVQGTVSNRDGIGARVHVTAGGTTYMREIDGGSSFMSRHSLTAHVGLGAATTADVTVTFPSGITQELLGQNVDQTLTVVEPAAPSSAN